MKICTLVKSRGVAHHVLFENTTTTLVVFFLIFLLRHRLKSHRFKTSQGQMLMQYQADTYQKTIRFINELVRAFYSMEKVLVFHAY